MRTTPLQSTVSFITDVETASPTDDDFIEPIQKRAPTLYVIIVMKLEGFCSPTALTAYTLSDNDLPAGSPG